MLKPLILLNSTPTLNLIDKTLPFPTSLPDSYIATAIQNQIPNWFSKLQDYEIEETVSTNLIKLILSFSGTLSPTQPKSCHTHNDSLDPP